MLQRLKCLVGDSHGYQSMMPIPDHPWSIWEFLWTINIHQRRLNSCWTLEGQLVLENLSLSLSNLGGPCYLDVTIIDFTVCMTWVLQIYDCWKCRWPQAKPLLSDSQRQSVLILRWSFFDHHQPAFEARRIMVDHKPNDHHHVINDQCHHWPWLWPSTLSHWFINPWSLKVWSLTSCSQHVSCAREASQLQEKEVSAHLIVARVAALRWREVFRAMSSHLYYPRCVYNFYWLFFTTPNSWSMQELNQGQAALRSFRLQANASFMSVGAHGHFPCNMPCWSCRSNDLVLPVFDSNHSTSGDWHVTAPMISQALLAKCDTPEALQPMPQTVRAFEMWIW